jgi:hypothetical protein
VDPGTLPAIKVPPSEIIPDGLLRQVQLAGYLFYTTVRKLIFDLPQL